MISNSTVSLEGDKVHLLCNAINDIHANYSLQINWYKGNIPEWKRILLYNETAYVKDSRQLKSTLTLDPVNSTDDGVYTCRAFNHPDLYSESKTNLTVECELTNNYIITLLQFNADPFRWSTCFHSKSVTLHD